MITRDHAVWKTHLLVVDEQFVGLPPGSELLKVDIQGGDPCLWFLASTTLASVKRKILIRGTGHQMSGAEKKYVGTFTTIGGALVWHVFDGGES